MCFSGASLHELSKIDIPTQMCIGNVNEFCESKTYDEANKVVFKHFENIFLEYNCPKSVVNTFHSLWDCQQLKMIVKNIIINLWSGLNPKCIKNIKNSISGRTSIDNLCLKHLY